MLFIFPNKIGLWNPIIAIFFPHRNKLLFSQPWLRSHKADCEWEQRISDGRHGTHQRAGGCWSCAFPLWVQWHCFHNNTQDTSWLPCRTHFLQKRYQWSNQSSQTNKDICLCSQTSDFYFFCLPQACGVWTLKGRRRCIIWSPWLIRLCFLGFRGGLTTTLLQVQFSPFPRNYSTYSVLPVYL